MNGFGSVPYYLVNELTVVSAKLKAPGSKVFKSVVENGQWSVKKIDFTYDKLHLFNVTVAGQGTGFLYAAYTRSGKEALLDIIKVTPGVHQISVTPTLASLPNFRLGVSTTIPKGYRVSELSQEQQYNIRNNSLLTRQKAPSFETPGIGYGGFGGLGAAGDQQDDVRDLLITGWAVRDKNKVGKGLWDGYIGSYIGEFRGKTSPHHVGASGTPQLTGSYHGNHGHGATMFMAKYNDANEFIGWQAVKNWTTTMSAGVPMMLVFEVKMREAEEFATVQSGSSWLNRKMSNDDKVTYHWNPFRHHDFHNKAHFSKENFCFIDKSFFTDPQPMIEQRIQTDAWVGQPRPVAESEPIIVSRMPYVGGLRIGGVLADPLDIAMKVEWFNEGSWTAPQKHPPVDVSRDGNYSAVVFRFPRQLSPETDKDILERLDAQGVNYSYTATKDSYPCYIGNMSEVEADLGYLLIGRPNAVSSYEEGGKIYVTKGKQRPTPMLMIKYEPAKNYNDEYPETKAAIQAGNEPAGHPKPGWVKSHISMKVEDPEKMARMNWPEIISAHYPPGGFKPGGTLIGVGRGMSSQTRIGISVDQSPNDFMNSSWGSNGSGLGTQKTCIVKPTAVISSIDLMDETVGGEEQLILDTWASIFKNDLSIDFFTELFEADPDQDPQDKHTYVKKDPISGLNVKCPYQIILVTLPESYDGPYYDYITKEEIVTEIDTEGIHGEAGKEVELLVKKLVINDEKSATTPQYRMARKEPVFFHVRTPYDYYTQQQFKIIDEVIQQVELYNKGYTPEEVIGMNATDYEVVSNEESAGEALLQQWHEKYGKYDLGEPGRDKDTGGGGNGGNGGGNGGGRGFPPETPLYVRSFWDRFKDRPKWFATESDLKGISGFTNSRDFYVEDVTSKWGVASTTGSPNYDTDFTDIMPSDGSSIGTAQLGGVTDDLFKPIIDKVKEEADDIYDSGKSLLKISVGLVVASLVGPTVIRGAFSAASSAISGAKELGYSITQPTRGSTARRRLQSRRRR